MPTTLHEFMERYPELMTRQQVAELIDATISEMHGYMSQKALPAMNVNGYWKIKRSDVRAFIEDHRYHGELPRVIGADHFDALKFYRHHNVPATSTQAGGGSNATQG